MNEQEKKAYSKGYRAGSLNSWPEHKPPYPPQSEVLEIMKCARELRDSADGICAVLMEDDDFAIELSPKIDALDKAMIMVSMWLKATGDKVTSEAVTKTPKVF